MNITTHIERLNMKAVKTNVSSVILDEDDFKNWKSGKCKARKESILSEAQMIVNNYDTNVVRFELQYDDNKAKDFNISVITEMYEDNYIPKALSRYNRGEYSNHEKFSDGMFVSYDEFVEFVRYMQGDVVVHDIKDNLIGNFVIIQYIY